MIYVILDDLEVFNSRSPQSVIVADAAPRAVIYGGEGPAGLKGDTGDRGIPGADGASALASDPGDLTLLFDNALI